jgi:cytochrome P450
MTERVRQGSGRGGPPDLDFKSAANVYDPYPLFAWLRDHDPVHWNAGLRAWMVTRYDDVRAVLDDPGRFSSDRFRKVGPEYASQRSAVRAVGEVLGRWLVFRDPPDHTRLRALLQRTFTPRQLRRSRSMVQETLDALLDRAEERSEVDFVRDVAFPLPAIVIALLLGAPTEDVEPIKTWSDELAAYLGGSVDEIDNFERAAKGLAELVAYFRSLIDRRRRRPAEGLIDLMLAAEDGGDTLSDDEVVANCILLLFAGHETTTNLLANGLLHLLRRDDQLAALRAAPDLVPSAVEEFLRIEAPVPATTKVVTADGEWRGAPLRRGQMVLPFLSSANRDPRRFPDPDVLDVRRAPNRHLAFGHGIHFCLGAPLARLEGELAFRTLLARYGRIELLEPTPRWKPLLFFRTLERLPVRLASG